MFCAQCLVSWFAVAAPPGPEGDELRAENRRKKKVCPGCRTQVKSPPVDVWGLHRALALLRGDDGAATPPASQRGAALWEGIFDPTTLYHVIRDEDDGVLRCGVCSSEIMDGACTNTRCSIVYDGISDEEHGWNASVALTSDNVEGDEGEEDEDGDDAGSLDDFLVDDEAVEDTGASDTEDDRAEGSVGSVGSAQDGTDASDSSSVVAVSPPRRGKRARPSNAPRDPVAHQVSDTSSDSDAETPMPQTLGHDARRSRLQALLASRTARARGRVQRADTSSSESEDGEPTRRGEERDEYESRTDSDRDDEGLQDAWSAESEID
ncbi:E3 ubiquitin ligase [Malassezia sp. CBS 17886]|nr:E3 ubiquitin ligase [Malassezia sp. CBS 17886]